MKKLLILLLVCSGFNSANAISIEQFDREQAAYQQELHHKVREAGYDPTSKKSIAEQYKEKRLTEQTIKHRLQLQQEYEREYNRYIWLEKNKSMLLFSLAGITILLFFVVSIYLKKHKKHK